MLNIDDAVKIVRKNLPFGKIQAQVEYNELYLFQVFTEDPMEEEMDPFYSVNKNTGEFRDFSIITDGNITEVVSLFTKANAK